MSATQAPQAIGTTTDAVPTAGRCPRDLRDHGRPGQGDDVPIALPAGEARAARLPDRRRGVDDWTLDQLVQRARESIVATGEQLDEDVFDRFAARLSYVSGDFADAATYSASVRRSRTRTARVLPRDPAVPVRDGRQGPVRGRSDGSGASSSRNPSAMTSHQRAHSPRSCTSTSTSRSCSGSTTTSERWASRRSSTCGSPTRCSSRSGIGTTSSACRSRWPRASGSKIAATSTTRSARCATSSSTTSCRSSAMRRWNRRRAATRRRSRTRRWRSSAIDRADPAHYVRGQYDGYRDIDGVAADSTTETYAALRLEIDNWRWSGVPVLHSHGQAAAGHPDRGPTGVQAPAPAGLRRSSADPEPNQLVVRLDPDNGSPVHPRCASRGHRRGRADPVRRRVLAEKGGEGATPYEVLLHAALVGDTTRFTRQDGVEETWRIMQPLLDAPPPVHVYAPGSWGPDARRQARRRARPLARAVDRVVSSRASGRTLRARAERRRPVAVPADRRLRVPLQLPHGCARRARRGDRLALRPLASTPPACSGASSTARPDVSGSAPFGINHPTARAYEPGRMSSSRPGRRPAAGSSCATR